MSKLEIFLSTSTAVKSQPGKKLKPLQWSKINRVGQDSLWAEAENSGEAARAPEIDMSELETLFSASNPNSDKASKLKSKAANKPEKVQLIDHKRAYNCEIMLSKVKDPIPELMEHVLSLDETAMDIEQVENFIKFCPNKEEMELIKGYQGEHEKLGKCEQFCQELMKVPRCEAKLTVFAYKYQFSQQVSDLRDNLNGVYLSVEQIRSSVKLRRVMQTILSLGNALNQGTTRGAAVGFKLDSLLKLNETRARSNKMTLMHYLCKVLADKLPELLDFSKELGSLEPASKIQLKCLAEEMQSITKGLEKVVQEKKLCKKDGHGSKRFRKSLKKFLASAEPDVKSLASNYSGVGKSVDALIKYFGEDPTCCPYESVVSTLLSFVKMFNQAHEENCKQIEAEKKAAQKAAEQEKSKAAEQDKLRPLGMGITQLISRNHLIQSFHSSFTRNIYTTIKGCIYFHPYPPHPHTTVFLFFFTLIVQSAPMLLEEAEISRTRKRAPAALNRVQEVAQESLMHKHIAGNCIYDAKSSFINNLSRNNFQELVDKMDEHLTVQKQKMVIHQERVALQKQKMVIHQEKVAVQKQKADLAILKLNTDDLDSDDLQAVLAMKKVVRDKYL